MPEIHIAVENGVASQRDTAVYICGSGDFTAVFAFEAGWPVEDLKTARFQTESTYQDVLFRGNACPVPVFTNARKLEVGVYCGNLRTTTPARIAIREGIRSAWGPPEDPVPSLYDQILEAVGETDLRLEEVTDGVVLTVCFRGGERKAFLRHSEIYVGSGPMPEGYRVQVDPTGENPQLFVRAGDGSIVPVPAIQGPKGEKGDKGDKGDTGETGATGAQGPVGPAIVPSVDINGVMSFSLQNVTSPPQSVNVRGPQGPQGVQGEQGAQGARGPQGIQGVAGAQGPKGDQGETGPAGPTGPQGPTGAAGAKGAKGDKGDKGDAFTYADFTEEQLAALKGPKGDKGADGATGAQGPQGIQGSQGAAGARGVRVRPVHRAFKERQAPLAPKVLSVLRAHKDRRENGAMMARMDAASLFRTFI